MKNKKWVTLYNKSFSPLGFYSPEGENDFKITEDYIKATDWENRSYKFNFDGNPILDEYGF